jgi:hypothetical protein
MDRRNVVSSFTRVYHSTHPAAVVRFPARGTSYAWAGLAPGLGGYPSMEGAIDALDPFQGFDLVGACGHGPHDWAPITGGDS